MQHIEASAGTCTMTSPRRLVEVRAASGDVKRNWPKLLRTWCVVIRPGLALTHPVRVGGAWAVHNARG